jgi:predicted metal-binding membrane protein
MTELVARGARSEESELGAAFGAVRAKLVIVVVLLVVAGVAWFLTAERMAGMDAGPGTDLGAFGWFAGVFALGVMSLAWMGLVAALVALEKLAPWRRAATVATAAVLLALAVLILAAPHDVPALVVPDGSTGAVHAIKVMT